eukprot:12886481-Prorocentrum_lima.AAC.1
MTQAVINGLAADVPAVVDTQLSNPQVAYSSIILNAETEELKDVRLHTSMVLRDHGLLTCSLLVDWGGSTDPNILIPPGSSISEFMEPDTKLKAFSDVDDFIWDLADLLIYGPKLHDAHIKSPVP